MKRRKDKYKLINPSHKDKVAPAELELLHTRVLLCIRNFTHYKGGPEAIASVERLLKDYKKFPDEIKKKLLEAFDYLRETNKTKKPEELEEGIKEAKRAINSAAKKLGIS